MKEAGVVFDEEGWPCLPAKAKPVQLLALAELVEEVWGAEFACRYVSDLFARFDTSPAARLEGVDRAIGLRVRLLRVTRGMSTDQLAHILSVPVDQVDAWEQGQARIPVVVIFSLAAVLHCSIGVFFRGLMKGDPNDPLGLRGRIGRFQLIEPMDRDQDDRERPEQLH